MLDTAHGSELTANSQLSVPLTIPHPSVPIIVAQLSSPTDTAHVSLPTSTKPGSPNVTPLAFGRASVVNVRIAFARALTAGAALAVIVNWPSPLSPENTLAVPNNAIAAVPLVRTLTLDVALIVNDASALSGDVADPVSFSAIDANPDTGAFGTPEDENNRLARAESGDLLDALAAMTNRAVANIVESPADAKTIDAAPEPDVPAVALDEIVSIAPAVIDVMTRARNVNDAAPLSGALPLAVSLNDKLAAAKELWIVDATNVIAAVANIVADALSANVNVAVALSLCTALALNVIDAAARLDCTALARNASTAAADDGALDTPDALNVNVPAASEL